MGSRFTWMRGLNSESFKGARLDRALSNIQWRMRFPNAMIHHLPIVGSDHSPLLLNTAGNLEINKPSHFRYNLAWSTHPSFLSVIKDNWNCATDLDYNKRRMTEVLPRWNKEIFGNVFQRKRRLLSRIEGTQRGISLNARSDLIRLDRKLRNELDNTLYQEELIWFQRSREEWKKLVRLSPKNSF
ncbi:PREDICTED: uncharacterized protein LOC109169292 [Ipomoea nil]|uniref:uncharacterized protein LOC109169292 n=1 Tax=Ipomoea nil TaxID=35883 RepID=UPI000900BE15|nr:PREDICTED: uncharacterized protein LOC109169292 [Ipomoea nil]